LGDHERRRIKERDYELAAKLAKASVDASGGKQSRPAGHLCPRLVRIRKAGEAVEWQKKAVAASSDADQKEGTRSDVKKYQTNWRRSDWSAGIKRNFAIKYSMLLLAIVSAPSSNLKTSTETKPS